MNMEQFFVTLGVAILLLMVASLYRVVAGPTVIDRILGVNVIGTKTTVVIIIVGTLSGRVEMFIDIGLAYALLNFITTIAAARFFQRQSQPATREAAEAETAPSVPPPAEGGMPSAAVKEGSHAA